MSIIEIISNQLNSYPKLKKSARIAYFSDKPLSQVHMDHGFWQNSGGLNENKTPFLVIVDVATRFTMIFTQTKKSEKIKAFIEVFIKTIQSKWSNTATDMLLITDGARELKVNDTIAGVYVHSRISKGINKAVLAEVSIRKIRAILRDYEVKINLHNIGSETNWRIDETNLKDILLLVQHTINQKAKLRKPKDPVPYSPPEFNLGDPVFALNFYKYYPHALKATLVKQSYMLNWYYEPFYVSKIFLINGIYKYSLKSYYDHKDIKYSFYSDQLQKIDPRFAADYIKYYVKKGSKISEFEEDY